MTLGNMRANGVRTLAIYCDARACNHERVLVDLSTYPDDVPVPSFGPRMVRGLRRNRRRCGPELE
jgi:hypothetical protein